MERTKQEIIVKGLREKHADIKLDGVKDARYPLTEKQAKFFRGIYNCGEYMVFVHRGIMHIYDEESGKHLKEPYLDLIFLVEQRHLLLKQIGVDYSKLITCDDPEEREVIRRAYHNSLKLYQHDWLKERIEIKL